MKRILLLFSAIMLSCIALWAHDVEIDYIYYNLDETNKTAEVTYRGDYYSDYDDEYSGSVTIPETITYNSEIYSVTSIRSLAFDRCSQLTSVTIPNSVTSIGSSAFSGCSGLTEILVLSNNDEFSSENGVLYNKDKTTLIKYPAGKKNTSFTIPSSVTTIGESAFSNCSGLTSVTIPNSVTSIGSSVFSGCSGLTSVTIPNSVTSIGSSAFYGCSGLTSISIGNSVTSIGEYAFEYCSGLTSVIWNAKNYKDFSSYSSSPFNDIRSRITSFTFGNEVEHIPSFLCCGMSKLTEITIPNSVTSIGSSAFSGSSGLTSVTIPNSVTSIGYSAFSGCSGLTSITIPNSVTSIGDGAFYDTGIYNNNSNWDNGVLYIDNCLIEAQSYVVKSSYTIKEGTRIISGGAFYNFSRLTSVTIPNSVTSIGDYAFRGCSGLTEVTIPNSVTSIGDDAFYGCSGLTSVTIPNSVTSIGDAAFSVDGLTSVIWNAKNCEDFEDYDETPFYNIRSSITSFTFGNEVEHIPAYLCYGMSKLTEMTIPKNVVSIGASALYCSGLTKVNYLGTVEKWVEFDWNYSDSNPTYYAKDLYINNELLTDVKITIADSIKKYAFYNCQSIKSVEIGNSVTTISSSAFNGCSSLTSVIWNAKNCKDFSSYSSSPFYNIRSNITSFTFGNEVKHIPAYLCYEMSKLSEVTIPNSVTSIGKGAFSGCSGLTSITIPNSVTSIGSDAFFKCSGLTKVNYLGTVDKWVEIDWGNSNNNPTYYAKDLYINNELLTDVKITTADSIKFAAFYNCQSIKSVEIGERVTSIGNSAFSGCSGLTSVSIGESVTSIGQYAFKDCSGLTSVTIPNSVTTIGSSAFSSCSELTSVSIGESVTSIGSSAFSGCDKLRKVTAYPTTVPNVYKSSFAHYNAALYVPCDVYDDYFFDEVWGTFKVTDCIAAEEVDAPDKVEIEVDEDNNANVIWPSTDGAKKYELEISKDGEVFCTLLFNENGQLTSIDFGNRSASVGFQFTVTGLDGASKYAYSMVAMDKKGNELQSYKGTFTTNGYVPGPGEEDEPTSITETLANANITVSGGSISADADFSIYNTIGQDVTAFNGSLQPGIYVVALGEDRVKIMIQ